MKIKNINDVDALVKEVLSDFNGHTERAILGQLNEFIKRGLIVVCMSGPVFTRDPSTNELVISRSVELKLKDQEYIERLETENKALKTIVDSISEHFNALQNKQL